MNFSDFLKMLGGLLLGVIVYSLTDVYIEQPCNDGRLSGAWCWPKPPPTRVP